MLLTQLPGQESKEMDSEQSNNNANATNKSHAASFSPPPVPLLCGVDDLEMDSEGLIEALMCLQNWMIEDIKGTLEGTHACSIVTEDSEEEGEVVDYIDMDVDDVETSDFED
ncbi:hypothetical protein K7X08_035496 [Anisodus acutangulus]|uniref:Uncharacterized protein n=1 Tax=Anisodus acutangulus TaxID=402998 RepID=A0A9Q1LKL6_9SOLA|nr:hypothetical protein K7X08_035496 [Anisodus acutangulus]